MTGCLRTLLERLADPRPVVTARTTERWPRGTAERFVALGLLAPLPAAEAVGCDSCGRDHVEPVVWTDTPNGPPRAFLWCERDGRVRVDPERLRRWAVWAGAFGRVVSGTEPTDRLIERVWKLGPLRIGSATRMGWLVAGWRGETGLADRVPELVQPNAVVFVPNELPPPAVWGDRPPPVLVPLSDVLHLSDAGLTIDPHLLATHLAVLPSHGPATTPAESLPARLSAAELARRIGRPPAAVESFLRRLRASRPDCFVESDSPRRNEPRYLYRTADVWPLLGVWADGR